MNRALLPLLAVTLLCRTAVADYVPTSFVDLVATSPKIAVGKITAVGRDTVTLTVEDVIVGPGVVGETLPVQRFRDWACAWRWSPYEEGQRVLMFLNRRRDDVPWVIRGSACEGESPVVKNLVYANFHLPGKNVPYGHPRVDLVAVPYDDLRAAIVDFRNTFRVSRAKNPWRKDGENSVFVPFERIQRIEEPSASTFRPRRPRSEFETRSTLHQYLADSLEHERRRMRKYRQAIGDERHEHSH